MPLIQKTLKYTAKRIVVKINNVDRSDLINFDSLEIQNNLYSKVDTCYFTYEKYGSRTYVPEGGDEVGVWDRDTKIFGGKITNVKVRVEGKVRIYDIECKDWVDQLDGKLVTESYENKTVNQIITDLQSKYATDFDISNVNCSTNIEAIYFDMKPMSKCLDELAEIAGYHWYVDPDKKIYFFAEGSITSPFDITDTNGHCITQSLEIEEDYEQIKNRINILGGNIANVQVHDDTSIANYGEHEVVIRDDTLTSTAEATQKANAVLAAFKDPIKKGSFETYDAGLVAGQKININSAIRGVNQDFIIQSVRFKARTPTDFSYKVEVMTQQGQGLIDLFEQEIINSPAVKESFGNRDFTCDIKFTVVNYHKIEWEAGHIIMSSGETYNINAGSREFTNAEVCYFKPSTSTTELQFSTNFGDGVGSDRIALGYAIPNPNTAKGAQFIPKGFMGGVRFWGGENIVARTIVADQIGLHALTSDLVTTGEFITLSAQIKDAIIKNAHIGEKITVGNTEADKTADNPQPVSWLTDAGAMAYEDMVEKAKLGSTIIQGGYIKADLLTADNIQTGTLNANLVNVINLNADNIKTGTLTGRTIRTGSTGENRIEILNVDDVNPNKIYFKNSGNTLLAKLERSSWAAGSSFDIWAYDEIDLYVPSGDGIKIAAGGIACDNLYPHLNNSYDLGSSSLKWRNLHISGDIILPTNTGNINGDLVPTTNDYFELGLSPTQKWYKIWAHYTGFGDVGFANNFRITEEEGEKEGLAVYNQNDKKIMVLDEDGNLWLAGKLNLEINMKTKFPFYKKILTKKELKKVGNQKKNNQGK